MKVAATKVGIGPVKNKFISPSKLHSQKTSTMTCLRARYSGSTKDKDIVSCFLLGNMTATKKEKITSHIFARNGASSPGTCSISDSFDGTDFVLWRKNMLVTLSAKNKIRIST